MTLLPWHCTANRARRAQDVMKHEKLRLHHDSDLNRMNLTRIIRTIDRSKKTIVEIERGIAEIEFTTRWIESIPGGGSESLTDLTFVAR
jgi:hypothetical protein